MSSLRIGLAPGSLVSLGGGLLGYLSTNWQAREKEEQASGGRESHFLLVRSPVKKSSGGRC